jgi:hypothetical protein
MYQFPISGGGPCVIWDRVVKANFSWFLVEWFTSLKKVMPPNEDNFLLPNC